LCHSVQRWAWLRWMLASNSPMVRVWKPKPIGKATLTAPWNLRGEPSCPAKAGHPVRRGFSVNHCRLWNTGSPACAGDDDWMYIRDLAAQRVRGLHLTLALLKNRGRREDRVRAAPAVSRARCTRQKRTRAYRFSGGNPAFPAQWFYGLYRALPGERAFLPPSLAETSANLTPASRRQDHTTSPYASRAFVLRAFRVHRISPHVRDDRDPPLIWVRRAKKEH